MLVKLLYTLTLFYSTLAFSQVNMNLSPFNRWHCIDFIENIDKSKPHAYNIGDLPLVTWFDDKNNKPYTTVNICSHMGSKLDKGDVKDGCLTCPYHGLQHGEDKTFGDTMVFQNQLWWSYNPIKSSPPTIPLFNSKKYASSRIKIDVNANIIDCAFNTMDVNHPAHVHNNMFGFGSNIPPTNVKKVQYPHDDEKIGFSFNYHSVSNLVHFKREIRKSKNFHIYEYPYSTWSRVSLPSGEHLFVNVNMLPLSRNKTRWLVTLQHNFWKSSLGKVFMRFAADCILYQDQCQMNRQSQDSVLKHLVSSKTVFENEEHFNELRKMFENYNYPDHEMVAALYKQHIKNSK